MIVVMSPGHFMTESQQSKTNRCVHTHVRQKAQEIIRKDSKGSCFIYLNSCGRSWGSPVGVRAGDTGSGTARTRGTTGSEYWCAAAAWGSSRRTTSPRPTVASPWCRPPPPARTRPPPRPGRPSRRCGNESGTGSVDCYCLWWNTIDCCREDEGEQKVLTNIVSGDKMECCPGDESGHKVMTTTVCDNTI